MGNAKSSLFVEKFQEFKTQWKQNQVRTAGFIAYTKAAERDPRSYGTSIEVSTLPSLERINSLGFFTVDSQSGAVRERAYCDGFIPSRLLGPFMEYIKTCNEDVSIVVFPNDKTPEHIPLTRDVRNGVEVDFTSVPVYNREELETYVIPEILNAGERGTTPSYYKGEPVGRIEIDLNQWQFITIYDKVWEHSAIDKTGLFTCIEAAMTHALSQAGGRRRRSNVRSRSRRGSWSSRRRTLKASAARSSL
jgi:hypothetical protein